MSLLLFGCVSTPERIDELETARARVTEVETSPRAGIAATDIAEARKSLDRANRLVESRWHSARTFNLKPVSRRR